MYANAQTTGTENGHDWVDLGLPSGTLWATCNVGATAPEEYGDYFAWGEIATKTTYNSSTYKYADGSRSTLTKYCSDASYGKDGFTDELTTLTAADDAATQNWGGKWRMPTGDEWVELNDSCDWTWTTLNDVVGYKVKASNGNSIFLPAAGFRRGDELRGAGSSGCYWSSSNGAGTPPGAVYVYFDSDGPGKNFDDRDYGLSVRPVYDEKIKTYTISLTEMENGTIALSDITAPAGKKITLTITSNFGYLLQSLNVMCGENEVAVTGNSFIMPAGDVTISAIFVTPIYVDLGLPSGLLWATYNIGATKPEGYGDYYAWGEIATKITYNWSTYKYANGSSSTLTKYCDNSKYGQDGFTDTLTTLEAADDAATQNWSGNWRMPTDGEWQELIDNCTWTWTTKDSVNGYEVKATNGNSIFLPAAGYRIDDGLIYAGSGGFYWSSSLYTNYPGRAQGVDFFSYDRSTYSRNRYNGYSVRPVCKK